MQGENVVCANVAISCSSLIFKQKNFIDAIGPILYGKYFMSLEFPPSYSHFPMYHRNDKLMTVIIIL